MKLFIEEILCKFIWCTTNEILKILWIRFPGISRQGVLNALRELEKEGIVVRRGDRIRHGNYQTSWRKND